MPELRHPWLEIVQVLLRQRWAWRSLCLVAAAPVLSLVFAPVVRLAASI